LEEERNVSIKVGLSINKVKEKSTNKQKSNQYEKGNIHLRRKGTITKRFLWSPKGFKLWTSADLKLI
jgi:hypothetical protein